MTVLGGWGYSFHPPPPPSEEVVHVWPLFAPRGLRGEVLDTWAVVHALGVAFGGRGYCWPPLPLIGACRSGPFAHVEWLGEA